MVVQCQLHVYNTAVHMLRTFNCTSIHLMCVKYAHWMQTDLHGVYYSTKFRDLFMNISLWLTHDDRRDGTGTAMDHVIEKYKNKLKL